MPSINPKLKAKASETLV